MRKALIFGITASLFFASAFIFNQQMSVSGGSWIWSSSLRYIFMLPILMIIMIMKNQLITVLKDIARRPGKWMLWSTIGFGVFYAPLTFVSEYGASWLVAGTWQITIIAGALLTPLFFKKVQTEHGIIKVRNKIPRKSLMMSSIILIGIFLMQFQQAKNISVSNALIGTLPVIIGAFAYPLGNRKMIEVSNNEFSTLQRIFGMTLCSMPFWMVLVLFGAWNVGMPSRGQVIQSFIVAVFSGIIATTLFFKATDMVSEDPHKLAVIESTQSGEVIFTLLGGIFLFHDKIPTTTDLIGISLVVIGIILNSLIEA
jgi:drug/metabolite transporter (DMT)-like permease